MGYDNDVAGQAAHARLWRHEESELTGFALRRRIAALAHPEAVP